MFTSVWETLRTHGARTRGFYPRKEGDVVVPMNYATRFAGGDATERFEWIVKGSDAKLVSYRIDADRLKSH